MNKLNILPTWIKAIMTTVLTSSLVFTLMDVADDLTAVSWN